MKLNLIRNPETYYLHGYTNVSLFMKPDVNKPDLVLGDYARLDSICSANEATELRAIDILDYYPLEQYQQTIGHWVSKLRHGAIITITGLDLFEVNTALFRMAITPDDFNQLVFSSSDKSWNTKKSVASVHQVGTLLINSGLNLLSKEFTTDYRYVITARRP